MSYKQRSNGVDLVTGSCFPGSPEFDEAVFDIIQDINTILLGPFTIQFNFLKNQLEEVVSISNRVTNFFTTDKSFLQASRDTRTAFDTLGNTIEDVANDVSDGVEQIITQNEGLLITIIVTVILVIIVAALIGLKVLFPFS